jgi:hypothetical protein
MSVVCPACNECIGVVNGGSFAGDMLLADALGVYHQHLCRASREDYYNTKVVFGIQVADCAESRRVKQ